jgi:putative tryptophan/tyrosine transport system substrate-binding protein
VVPKVESFGVLINGGDRGPNFAVAQAAARELGWKFRVLKAGTYIQLNAAFETLTLQKVGALYVTPDPFFIVHRAEIVELAAQYAIPAIYTFRAFVIEGGLVSYGPDVRETNRVAGNYVGRILNGAKPADLRCSRLPKSSWSSISRRPTLSASRSRIRCWPPLTK